MTDRIFPSVAEGWISNVVRKRRRHHHVGQITGSLKTDRLALLTAATRQLIPLVQKVDQHPRKCSTDTGDFKRMRQPVMDVRVGFHRMDLGLLAESAEGAGVDDAVVVRFES